MRRGIIDGYCRVADAFAIDHQLEFRVLHAGVPKRRSILFTFIAAYVLRESKSVPKIKNTFFMIVTLRLIFALI